jgi:uncharacterized SAM-binding protein YcdF (DUF218 family)
VQYREHSLELGVPDDAILVEPEARNTADNITFTRQLLEDRGIKVGSVILISRPYQQRRAYATCKRLWPEVDVIRASRPLPLDESVESIGDMDRVITMLVGDTQRITVYAERGFAIKQEISSAVTNAYERLAHAGFTKRLIET